MNPVTAFLVLACVAASAGTTYKSNLYLGLVFFAAVVVIAVSIKMANVWEQFVILRMGKVQSVKGAGIFVIIPILDRVVVIIDGRI